MNQRQLILLKGDIDWCLSSADQLLAGFDKNKLIFLSCSTDSGYKTIPQKQAQKQLGKEFDGVIYDGLAGFNPDNFGAIVGTIKAGGALIIFLPSVLPDTLWLQRFNQIAAAYSYDYQTIHLLKQGDNFPEIFTPQPSLASIQYDPTVDQQAALQAILKVVKGHRRRPLVLSSDRGRGKSAVLGIAAAALIKQGKQTIIVTAPSLATVETVFEHAARLLPDVTISKGYLSLNKAEIKFIAPDVLVESDQKADLLLVDEAAAIPASMLAKLLHKFSRIVFATTLHGYEGTGLGFAIRFKQILEQYTPYWRGLTMTQPIRWAENDPLEAFSFKALLLNASPVTDEIIQYCQPTDCVFEKIARSQLVKDETSLIELFGLMVLAHYRTRPSDLQFILDREDVSIYVMRHKGHIIASAWLVNEGGLDEQLAHAIHGGTRRLKGHLLPQSLLAHAGISNAGGLNYQRVVRIAVHPAIQHRGIGHLLLTNIVRQVNKSGIDILGTSFAVSEDLLNFWSRSQFVPVRLGVQQDDVSGGHSVMMLHAISSDGEDIIFSAQQRLQVHWPFLIRSEFQYINPALIVALTVLIPTKTAELSIWDNQDIAAFCHQQRPYESSRIALSLWLIQQIKQPQFVRLSAVQQQLSIMTLLQQRQWTDIGKQLNLSGKTQIIKVLRDATALLNSHHELG